MELTYFSLGELDVSFLGDPKRVSEKDAKIIIFTGGADVHPGLYGDEVHSKTHFNLERDLKESELFDRNLHKLKVCICRGSQLSCVKSGGKLFQHVDNHGRNHYIKTPNATMSVTSSHHQMMNLLPIEEEDYILLGYAKESKSIESEEGIFHELMKEPELVYFKNTHSLAMQFHPEWMPAQATINVYINKLINKLLNGKKLSKFRSL